MWYLVFNESAKDFTPQQGGPAQHVAWLLYPARSGKPITSMALLKTTDALDSAIQMCRLKNSLLYASLLKYTFLRERHIRLVQAPSPALA